MELSIVPATLEAAPVSLGLKPQPRDWHPGLSSFSGLTNALSRGTVYRDDPVRTSNLCC
jgi:hypothetical protein